MAQENERKVSALAMAKRSMAVTVKLTPDDVRSLRPAWSASEAEHFLQHHKAEIARILLEVGMAALAELIAQRESEARHDK